MSTQTQPIAPSAAPDLAVLASKRVPEGFSVDDVSYAAAFSTKWHAVYMVPSKGQPDRVRRVVYTEETQTWACSCPARPGTCWHCAMSQLAARVWWWRQLWRSSGTATLVEQDRQYANLLAEGEADEDDRIAWNALGDVLLERMAA